MCGLNTAKFNQVFTGFYSMVYEVEYDQNAQFLVLNRLTNIVVQWQRMYTKEWFQQVNLKSMNEIRKYSNGIEEDQLIEIFW